MKKKTNNQVQNYRANDSTRHLMLSIHKEQPMEVAKNLKQYMEGGAVCFDKLLSIPVKDRLPGLMKTYGEKKVHGILCLMLTDFCSAFNVGKAMNEKQVIACAYDIMVSAEEDQLSIEDIALFFSNARKGMYGKSYDRIDQQVIFEWLECHRQQRHEAYQKIKETKHLELKAIGPGERTNSTNSMEESFYNMAGRLEDLKKELKKQREINRASQLK